MFRPETTIPELLYALQEAEREQGAARKRKMEADMQISKHEATVERIWQQIAKLMQETGEYEVIIPSDVMDYKISYTTPKESVKVLDVESLPDQFVKVEKKPKLKELGELLRSLRECGANLPNYAVLEMGEPKLKWTAIKKQAKHG